MDNCWWAPVRLGRKLVEGKFVIPSGIRCTNAPVIARVFRDVPSIGIITTKSISALPREGYREPIYAEYGPGAYVNAVGLANPGAEHFHKELQGITVPENKFLLVSIFGGTVKEFVQTARTLQDVADGFELNMSCPHAKGYGVEVGHDNELVAEITRAVADETQLPVMVKLPASARDIGKTAEIAMQHGAAGITTINTVGPGMHMLDGQPVLFNQTGGLSGDGIRPIGLRCVQRVRAAIGKGPVIIGMGGISTGDHVADFAAAGADFFGVGSAVTGMNSETMARYFQALEQSLRTTDQQPVRAILNGVQRSMAYHRCTVRRCSACNEILFKLELDDPDGVLRNDNRIGSFYFLFVPGAGEKPFALFSAEDNSFYIKAKGSFTKFLATYPTGSPIYVRGPYGGAMPEFDGRTICLVGGGTGIAPLLEMARAYAARNTVITYLGFRSRDEMFGVDEFSRFSTVEVATDDGAAGFTGDVSEFLRTRLAAGAVAKDAVFINSGPEPMVLKCFTVQEQHAAPDNIWGAIPYITSCGVGICGRCSTPSGLLTCVDGPFLPKTDF